MIYQTALAALIVAAAQAASTDYKTNGANWKDDVPLCGTGKEQSPIDLKDATMNSSIKIVGTSYYDFVVGTFDPTVQSWHTDLPDEAKRVKANMQLTFADDSTADFTPKQFHFHAPSEHSVDGKLMDAEVHLVHTYKDKDTTYGSVLGIFFDKEMGGATDNAFLTSFFDAIDTRGAAVASNKKEVAIKEFLSGMNMEEFWSYDGSFTTPPCTEGIKWSVLKQVQPISEAQLKKFTDRLAGDANFAAGKGNNRVVQALNDRKLYMAGGATSTVTYAAALIAAISALAF